jgi:hypothetical protein
MSDRCDICQMLGVPEVSKTTEQALPRAIVHMEDGTWRALRICDEHHAALTQSATVRVRSIAEPDKLQAERHPKNCDARHCTKASRWLVIAHLVLGDKITFRTCDSHKEPTFKRLLELPTVTEVEETFDETDA